MTVWLSMCNRRNEVFCAQVRKLWLHLWLYDFPCVIAEMRYFALKYGNYDHYPQLDRKNFGIQRFSYWIEPLGSNLNQFAFTSVNCISQMPNAFSRFTCGYTHYRKFFFTFWAAPKAFSNLKAAFLFGLDKTRGRVRCRMRFGRPLGKGWLLTRPDIITVLYLRPPTAPLSALPVV